MSEATALIGVDWGTSNLRVMRIAEGGSVLESRSDSRGAGALASDQFAPVLREVAGDWLTPEIPVISCGMSGGRGKWREMPYLPCPVGATELARGIASPDDAAFISIVPGVGMFDDDGLQDVIRGEETQVFGLDDLDDALILAPGTHSKWIQVRAHRIAGFRTFMTGELFAAIRTGTIMGAGMGEPGIDADAFSAGVVRALEDPAVSAALFSVRVETLAGRVSNASSADYLSGILIGAEVAAQGAGDDRPITLVGAETLGQRYAAALALGGFTNVRIEDGVAATARGLWRIHQARGS